jgi:hypothetical protein
MENSNVNEDFGMKVDPIGDSSSPAPQPPVDERLQKALDKALYAGGRPAAQKIRNFLNGTWLGEGCALSPFTQSSVDQPSC